MPPAEFQIEPAATADIPRIIEILQVNFRDEFRHVISDEQIEYMLAKFYAPDALKQEMDHGQVYVKLHHDDEIRAFASYGSTPIPDELQLHKLFVDLHWHGKGYGGALIAYVQEQGRRGGCKTLMLTVNKRNTRAIAIYRKKGFEIREPIEVDIGSGFYLDDYVMAQTLTHDA